MSRLRFTTAHEVLEAFPSARGDIGVELLNEAPVACLQRLVDGGKSEAAISFCAYVLPRREAVWWGCRSVRALLTQVAAGVKTVSPTLDAAEMWVRRPDDGLRRSALALGIASDPTDPTTWLALAAGWSGGSMAPGEYAVPAQPHLTAKAVRAALLVALGRADQLRRAENAMILVAIGSQIAVGDEAI